MLNCLAVGAGGFVGSVCRYLIGLLPMKPESGFPLHTLLINLAGAFILGALTALGAKNPALSPRLMLMLRVGVCGGFTTFSTFAYESSSLMAGGKTALALCYVALSVVLGVLAAAAGSALALR